MESNGPRSDRFPSRDETYQASHGIRSERRIVTVLFCDVVDSTAIAERLDPEEWVEILDEAFHYLTKAIQRYEGTVLRLLGDAILAYFGAPVAHEDDPERAVLAGLAIIEELRPLQESLEREQGIQFNVRVGINTGEAIVGAIGVTTDEYTALGDAVNVAARMQQMARPGTVLISGDTYRHVSPSFEVVPLGEIEVKGKQGTVSAFTVLDYRPPSRLLRGDRDSRAPLVGRQRQLQDLERAFDDLERQRGQVVLLIGEAGLGKTRLIDEAHQRWLERSGSAGTWIESRGISYDAARPYGLFMQLLQEGTDLEQIESGLTSTDQRVLVAPGPPDESLGRVLRLREYVKSSGSDAGAARLSGQDFQVEFYDAVEEYYRGRSMEHALILVFDDLQWADSASTDLLIHMLTLVERTPIIILCAMRPERASQAWRVKQAIESDYSHRSLVISLAPLEGDDSDQLIESLLPGEEFPELVREIVKSRTEGNPLFVEELARAMRERDAEGSGDEVSQVPVPESLQALLTARIDSLDQGARRVLQYASVIGRIFSLRVLEHVLDQTGAVEDELITLERAGLIEESRQVSGRGYSFRHDLMREAAYNSILRRQRRAFHRKAGEAMERFHAEAIEAASHQLAYHFSESGDLDRGLKYTVMAAERAARVYAVSEAINQFSRAVDLARKAERSNREIAALLAERGRMLAVAGEFDRAQVDWEDSRSLSRMDGDERGEWRALIGLGDLWTGRHYDRSLEHFRQALELARSIDEPGIVARSLLQIGNWEVNNERADDARKHFEAALEIFEHLQDVHGIAVAEDLLGIAADIRGDLRAWRHHFVRAVDLYRELDNLQGLTSALTTLSALSSINVFEFFSVPLDCQFEDEEELSHEALDLSRKIGWRSGEAYALMTVSLRHLAAGEIGEALDLAMEANTIAESIEHREWTAGTLLAEALARNVALSYERSLVAAERAVEAAELSGSLHWRHLSIGMLAIARVLVGERGSARALLNAVDSDMPTLTLSQRQVWYSRAVLSLADGDPERSLEILTALIDTAPHVADERDVPYLARLRGIALAEIGRIDEALENLRLALDGAIERDSTSKLWRFHHSLGVALLRAGEQRLAGEHFQIAWMRSQALSSSITDDAMRTEFLNRSHEIIFQEQHGDTDLSDHSIRRIVAQL